jgi:uncharacterized damage-inducible protein DinB
VVKRSTQGPRPALDRADGAAVAGAFVAESRRRLRGEYGRKIRRVVSPLGAADLWWRPNPRSNAIGNLLLHLEGNLRQWIVCGLGDRAEDRNRDAEFAARRRTSARVLLARLERTVHEADAVLAALTVDRLLEPRRIQGYRVTGLQAVYHVVEHFSGHTGQILYIIKLRHDRDLDFYPDLAPRGRRAARPRHL